MEFLDHLKKGEFWIPVCVSCGRKAWPPSRHCPHCLSRTSLQKVKTTGMLLEFTSSYIKGLEGAYGVVDMAGLRLVGSFGIEQLHRGMRVRMSKCGVMPDGTAQYRFVPTRMKAINTRQG